ncbi:SMI1/KNR4 family protein [Chitinophaga sancti]|uniref:SMI1 / KNR4 family (SUKH-1) n=1 Tax=Chitinophaga sancti TaxID=1004 RepID=A0A1K1LN49_9BACT|nr:SMI1/KNR4 family protein [Chitinophaga sancti]WQD64996.1 SMI1/KNR4 family protein [Chitinophaga sancti]WQG89380.1 SMI1/KNR4 family protein [Chitinophaga sancti]SFW12325.1 SMI1 / KNR4 family (SUKH-1) [Chitinophaga sancti]
MSTSNELINMISTQEWDSQNPAAASAIESLEAAFGAIPEDYKALLLFSNGGSLYGKKTPFIVYSVAEVLALFKEKDLYKYIPQSLIFGGDGGGTIYCFDLRPDKGQQVFFIREEDAGYEPNAYSNIVFSGTTLTDTIQRIVNNEKLN